MLLYMSLQNNKMYFIVCFFVMNSWYKKRGMDQNLADTKSPLSQRIDPLNVWVKGQGFSFISVWLYPLLAFSQM